MDKNTFGSTPAAIYLAETLTKIGNERLSRSVSRTVNGSQTAVKQIVKAFEAGTLVADTVGNILRLMRLEVVNEPMEKEFSDLRLVQQLSKNVRIGSIKKAIRMAQRASIANRVMGRPVDDHERDDFMRYGHGITVERCFWDEDKLILAGIIRKSLGGYVKIPNTGMISYDTTTPELLMERSIARRKRLNKL